ncbi:MULTISPECIES: hypothetical protein [unclassified Streptomyces]|uniref:hypothetical protein n=1 Tax=unclassified Streptomyces TaxID=2593676 RepID=UPI00226DCB83|nr:MULTISPECIES: hypothetical protein [unclassified Streptomyces]MCY0922844.1 hypothetical protein [Streptomyces sp. H27-G5]MDJ0385215.1 hypothetical protein [Streptomyces sp. G-G2]
MELNTHERGLLHAVSQAPAPTAMSTFFPALNQAVPPEVHAPEDDPVRVAWADEQFALYGASVSLWQKNLVRVVHPANGERPDLVEATDEGRTALA